MTEIYLNFYVRALRIIWKRTRIKLYWNVSRARGYTNMMIDALDLIIAHISYRFKRRQQSQMEGGEVVAAAAAGMEEGVHHHSSSGSVMWVYVRCSPHQHNNPSNFAY